MGIKLITQAFSELYRPKISRLMFFSTCYFMNLLAGYKNAMGVYLYVELSTATNYKYEVLD